MSGFLQGFVLVHILWYILAVIADTRALPKPAEIYFNLGGLYGAGLGLHVLASLFRVVAGLGISLLAGIPLGMLMAYSTRWNQLLNPLVYFTYPIPKTALLPVVMLLFGLGDGSKILLIILIVIFQVIVSVRDAILNLSPEIYNPIKSLGASKGQIFRYITFPAVLPGLLTTLRLAIGTALSILFFTEGYGTHYGIGYYILDAWTRIDYLAMYAGIIVISLLGFILFILVDVLEEALCKWRF